MNHHQVIDRRNLALCQEAAGLVDMQPKLLERTRETVQRWMTLHADDPVTLASIAEWDCILRLPWIEICNVLLEAGEEGARRRLIPAIWPCLLVLASYGKR